MWGCGFGEKRITVLQRGEIHGKFICILKQSHMLLTQSTSCSFIYLFPHHYQLMFSVDSSGRPYQRTGHSSSILPPLYRPPRPSPTPCADPARSTPSSLRLLPPVLICTTLHTPATDCQGMPLPPKVSSSAGPGVYFLQSCFSPISFFRQN